MNFPWYYIVVKHRRQGIHIQIHLFSLDTLSLFPTNSQLFLSTCPNKKSKTVSQSTSPYVNEKGCASRSINPSPRLAYSITLGDTVDTARFKTFLTTCWRITSKGKWTWMCFCESSNEWGKVEQGNLLCNVTEFFKSLKVSGLYSVLSSCFGLWILWSV